MTPSDNLDFNSQELELLKELSLAAKNSENSVGNKYLSVSEWFNSYYHSGEMGKSLYPYWKERVEEVFSGKKLNYDELIITGGLSTGKSFFSLAVWMRMFYLLSLLKDPHEFLGLSKATGIRFAYLSVTKDEAGSTIYADLIGLIDSCNYFNEDFPRDRGIDSVIKFPKNINVIFGSGESDIIGSNTLSLIYDEANFAKEGGGKPGDVKKATRIYSQSRSRIKTRFTRENSTKFFLNMLISSNTHKGSFTEGMIALSRDSKYTKIIISKIFETKPKGTFSKEKFLFFSGDEVFPPKVIDSKSDLENILTIEEIEKISELDAKSMLASISSEHILKFHLIPVNFYDDCRKLPEQMVQDLVGISLASTGQFFRNKKDFALCVERGEALGLKHPFTREWIYLKTGDDLEIKDYINENYLKAVIGDRRCFLHIDQSETNNYTGIALSFALDSEEDESQKVVVPLMLQIRPPEDKGDRISLEKIRKFPEYLVDVLGLNLVKTTFDQYQSSLSIEMLNKRGIKAERFSVDRGTDHWREVAGLFYSKRMLLYGYTLFKKEWFTLILDRGKDKVDHLADGQKDISDAFVGSVYACMVDFGTRPDERKQNETLTTILEGMSKANDPDLNSLLLGGSHIPIDQFNSNGLKRKLGRNDGDMFFGNVPNKQD